mmetsp:Transcript_41655/g.126296  ORF Transcript_41655/g.126296 Transcript_41655/m.126296 type:complete len:375 (-) Transcript_41655:666-1790(-)
MDAVPLFVAMDFHRLDAQPSAAANAGLEPFLQFPFAAQQFAEGVEVPAVHLPAAGTELLGSGHALPVRASKVGRPLEQSRVVRLPNVAVSVPLLVPSKIVHPMIERVGLPAPIEPQFLHGPQSMRIPLECPPPVPFLETAIEPGQFVRVRSRALLQLSRVGHTGVSVQFRIRTEIREHAVPPARFGHLGVPGGLLGHLQRRAVGRVAGEGLAEALTGSDEIGPGFDDRRPRLFAVLEGRFDVVVQVLEGGGRGGEEGEEGHGILRGEGGGEGAEEADFVLVDDFLRLSLSLTSSCSVAAEGVSLIGNGASPLLVVVHVGSSPLLILLLILALLPKFTLLLLPHPGPHGLPLGPILDEINRPQPDVRKNPQYLRP